MLQDNSIIKKCRDCRGSGIRERQVGTSQHAIKACTTCNGTGKYKEEHYIIEANGIAFDSDFAGK